MYLEKIKNQPVYININCDLSFENKDILNMRIFKMTEMAKTLGASSVHFIDKTTSVSNKIVLQYIDSSYLDSLNDYIIKNADYVFEIFWCNLNKALTIENIWEKGKNVGFYIYHNHENYAELNNILKEEEYNFFDIKSYIYDFTKDEERNDVNVIN